MSNTSTQQPTKQGVKYHLARSTYITWFTSWLLGFGGQAAWPVLILCTLYMGAELYPGVNLPTGLNFAVFLAQLFALDMGGMGLVSMARQAKDDGNVEGAKEAGTLGKWLIGIVITSLVIVGAKQFLSAISSLASFEVTITPFLTVVEFILVIARVVCSVLYGKVMHTLKTGEHTTPPALTPAIDDIQAEIAEAVQKLADEIKDEQIRAFANFQQQLASQIPVIDQQAIAGGIWTALEPRLAGEMKRFQSEMNQHIAVSVERKTQQYFSTFAQSEIGSSIGTRPGSRPSDISSYGHGKSGNILPFHQEPAETSQEAESRKALVLRLYHEDTSRSDSDIATLSGVPNTTVWRYLKPYRDRAKTGEMPAIPKDGTA